MSLSHLNVVLLFYVVVVWSLCLSQTVSVVSVVQITLNSQVRNFIEVIIFTLFYCPSCSLVVPVVSANSMSW